MFFRRWSTQGIPSRPSQPRREKAAHRASTQAAPERRLKLELVDLDDRRRPISVSVKAAATLAQVESSLRHHYLDSRRGNIEPDDRIVFYSYDGRLSSGEIPRGASTLRYRVFYYDDEDDDDSIRIRCSTRVTLDDEQLDQLTQDIQAGCTVGALRQSIATFLELDDSNTVIISAVGGLNPGNLKGNNWESRQVQGWLCRRLLVDLAPDGCYMTLKAMNSEYIYHPNSNDDDETISARRVKSWLKSSLLTGVHHNMRSRVKVDTDEIKLIRRGHTLRNRSRVAFGDVLEFQLPHVVEERFLSEEAWLVPLTECCVVCSDDKRVSEMPSRITAACEHVPSTCKECISQWIASSMDTTAWDRLKCPECPQILAFDNIRAFASQEVFDRYDSLATNAALTSLHDFIWCLNPRCGSGQLHPASCPKVKCHACKASSCALHSVPWHRGETCEEYERRTKKQRKNEKASEQEIKKLSKPCPQCNRAVHKYTGCDHITCVCRAEWCYICLEPYTHDHNMFLQCTHKRTCKYFDNPPNYEGGRAFMPFLGPGFGRGAPPPFQRRRPIIVPPPPGMPPAPPPPPGPPGLDPNPFQFLQREFQPGQHGHAQANFGRHNLAGELLGVGAALMWDHFARVQN